MCILLHGSGVPSLDTQVTGVSTAVLDHCHHIKGSRQRTGQDSTVQPRTDRRVANAKLFVIVRGLSGNWPVLIHVTLFHTLGCPGHGITQRPLGVFIIHCAFKGDAVDAIRHAKNGIGA